MTRTIQLPDSLYMCPKHWQRFIASLDISGSEIDTDKVDIALKDLYNAYIDDHNNQLVFNNNTGYVQYMLEWLQNE